MPSFADSIFLFVLALLLFGPKKLPVLARELGKWVGEFRRASNEFRMQMEEELRVTEQADRQKQIAAMEAAAPVPPPLEQPEHPHLPRASENTIATPPPDTTASAPVGPTAELASEHAAPETMDGLRPIPIATSGSVTMMPPATGLPTPRPRNVDPLGDLLESIPETPTAEPEPAFAQHGTPSAPEGAAHGD